MSTKTKNAQKALAPLAEKLSAGGIKCNPVYFMDLPSGYSDSSEFIPKFNGPQVNDTISTGKHKKRCKLRKRR